MRSVPRSWGENPKKEKMSFMTIRGEQDYSPKMIFDGVCFVFVVFMLEFLGSHDSCFFPPGSSCRIPGSVANIVLKVLKV